MPISDEALQSEKNRFIAVKGEATLGQAIAALREFGGQPWWHLVVRTPGSWSVARFSELVANLAATATAWETKLSDLKQLKTASAVERGSIETKAAQALARKSSARVLVVTEKALPIGILVEGVKRGAAPRGGVLSLTSPNLDQLGGKSVKLKDYGSILLGSSKKR